MIKTKFSKLARSKTSLTIFCMIAICLLLDIALVIFNISEFAVIKTNSANLAGGFLAFNIAIMVLNILTIALISVLLILKNKGKIK